MDSKEPLRISATCYFVTPKNISKENFRFDVALLKFSNNAICDLRVSAYFNWPMKEFASLIEASMSLMSFSTSP